jgi:hypothetical protein
MLNHIQSWMSGQDSPDTDHLLENESTLNLHAAVSIQDDIGWENFFRARLTPLWAECRTNSDARTNKQWTHRLATWIWTTVLTAWSSRNQVVFGDTITTHNNVLRFRLEARVREIFTACQDLPSLLRQHHIHKPVDELLKAHPTYLTLWATQAEATIAMHRKAITQGYHHNNIRRYFAPRRA